MLRKLLEFRKTFERGEIALNPAKKCLKGVSLQRTFKQSEDNHFFFKSNRVTRF
jgi:hypothetical protein